ncbi:iron only hydrogenase large subunit domain-containing protein [Xylariaceae sp. FL0255]|nr:iron only hydrogenase large subunit domain-containing protein [Xylariaceae sp. FL0255]
MSAILSTDDLNDFISPGVACIKPVETLPSSHTDIKDYPLENEVILDGQNPSANTGPAQISLTDCLACSGCVTSAEAVLVSLQSHTEVANVLDNAPSLRIHRDTPVSKPRVEGLENPDSKLFVASVSPQTRASLAAASGQRISERDARNMVAQLLAGLGGLRAGGKWNNAFEWVTDTNVARDMCLALGAQEALSSKSVAKPILTSSCPGWVCYAEKTHPHVLPHISKVKSPQALMGTLLKTTLSRTLGISPDRIWHLAVMPCFDKKLEASREELTDSIWNGDGQPGRGVRDVDCVITTKEILVLAELRGLDFFNLAKEAVLPPSFPDPTLHEFLFSYRSPRQLHKEAGTSGGNLHYILQYVASQHPGSRIEHTPGRNADVATVAVIAASGERIFSAARYYGFRNIQNLVRNLKPAKAGAARNRKVGAKSGGLGFAYVEVMACPGGCTNGGGQIKVDDPIVAQRKGSESQPGLQEQKLWLAEVDEAYFSADESGPENLDDSKPQRVERCDVVDGISPSYVQDTLEHWSRVTGIDTDRLTSTSYREVLSDVGKTGQAGDAIQLASKW